MIRRVSMVLEYLMTLRTLLFRAMLNDFTHVSMDLFLVSREDSNTQLSDGL